MGRVEGFHLRRRAITGKQRGGGCCNPAYIVQSSVGQQRGRQHYYQPPGVSCLERKPEIHGQRDEVHVCAVLDGMFCVE